MTCAKGTFKRLREYWVRPGTISAKCKKADIASGERHMTTDGASLTRCTGAAVGRTTASWGASFMFFPVSGWFAAFVLTLVVELPIAAWLLRRVELDVVRRVVLIGYANLATHLAVWYVFSQLFLIGTIQYVLAAEAWAIGAEAVFFLVAFRGLGPRQAFAVAFAANVVSFAIGRIVGVIWPEVFR
jgi:hypothetical protein